ncbi:hypothetical protein LCGC14_1324730 [marine sediment metagenome]|uniref:Bulb-type lectin domain-containing protein n=1 Tax=marine sediment metagenome TaxID=412755 RepID=A0A0F9L445_9ZZZZ|nr:hypothetical protein [archaeon]HEC40708.1 hypothetical protein [bacterium]
MQKSKKSFFLRIILLSLMLIIIPNLLISIQKDIGIHVDERNKNEIINSQRNFNFYNTKYTTLESAASTALLWSFTLNSIREIDLSSDGNYIAVAGIEDIGGIVYLFNTSHSTPLWNYPVAGPYQSAIATAISSDGAYVAVGTVEGKLFLFNGTSGVPLWNYTTSGTIGSVAISSNGSLVVVGTSKMKILLFNLENSTPIWSYRVGRRISDLVISTSGNTIAVQDAQGRLYIFGKNSSIPIWIYSATYEDLSFYSAISLSSDGNYIVFGTGLGDSSTYLFNRSSNIPMWTSNFNSPAKTIEMSFDGNYIIEGFRNGMIQFFKKDNNISLWNYSTGSSITSVAISNNGDLCAALVYERGIFLFNKSSSNPFWEYSLIEHISYPYSKVVMSANGKIIVANNDNTIYLFNWDSILENNNDNNNPIDPTVISLVVLGFFSLIVIVTTFVLRRRKLQKDK